MSTAAVPVRETYSVPRQFSLRDVLGGMALFALLLGYVRWSAQPPAIPAFYVVFFAIIGLAQMVFQRSPRFASIATGVLYLPLCFTLEPTVREHLRFSRLGENLLMLAVAGGFLAYLLGTLAAGMFLVSDLLSRLARRDSVAVAAQYAVEPCPPGQRSPTSWLPPG